MIEHLPLGNPIRADARAIGFHLCAQAVQFLFEDFGPLVQLKLRKTLGENRLDLFEWMSFQEIEDHRIGNDELAVDGFRLAGQALCDRGQVDIRRRGHHGEADQVFAAPAGAPRQLLDLAVRQIGKVSGFADARLRDDDGTRRKINACSKGRRGKDRVETAIAHEFFDRDLPGRKVTGMMRRYADPLNGLQEGMLGDAGVLLDDLFKTRLICSCRDAGR